MTIDCAATVEAMNHGRKVENFKFHSTEKNWLLASAFSLCEDYDDEPCKINKELFFTKDLGLNWEVLASYVVDFDWMY